MSLQDKTKAEILERYRVAEQQNELMRDELAHLRSGIESAVAAERERWAKAAEAVEESHASDACGVACDAGRRIAAMIRSGE